MPRSRAYMDRTGSIHGGGGGFAVPDDARSHISQMSSRAAAKRATSIADLTGKPSYPGMASAMGLGLSRPDLRQSRQSLVSHHFAEGNGGGGGSGGGGRVSRASRKSSAAPNVPSTAG